MAKGYWIVVYHSISDPAALAEYAKVVPPIMQAAGGRFIVRGMPAVVHEAGLQQRTTVIEFDNLEKALAAYDDPAYKKALSLIEGKVERDLRIIAGMA